MTQRLRRLPAYEYRRERWRNGLGWTREIHREPVSGAHDGDGAWLWRLSIAEVERDAAFSAFPGVDRELVLLQGNGLHLRFDDGETVELGPPHGRFRFSGERSLHGEPIDGVTHDFNLMWRRDRIEADLWHRPLVGSMVLFIEPDECWALHVLAGYAQAGDDDALADARIGDTLLLRAGNTRARVAIDGGGEVLVMRMRERRPG
jgi:uncharacterized protein